MVFRARLTHSRELGGNQSTSVAPRTPAFFLACRIRKSVLEITVWLVSRGYRQTGLDHDRADVLC